jgi:hypothetical protein
MPPLAGRAAWPRFSSHVVGWFGLSALSVHFEPQVMQVDCPGATAGCDAMEREFAEQQRASGVNA